MDLQTSLSSVISTKPEYLKALQEMGIHTLEDLLLYFPKSYEDLSEYRNLNQVQNGEKVTVKGFFQGIKAIPTKGKVSLTKAQFFDHEGNPAEAVWFNQPFVRRVIPMDTQVVVTAKIQRQYGKISLQSPMVEPAQGGSVHSGGLIPVYPQHAVITSKWLREKINPLLVYAKEFEECLPDAVIEEEGLMSKKEAVQEIHFPTSQKRLQKAKDRLAYEELFLLQLNAVQRKKEWQESAKESGHHHEVKMDVDFVKNFFSTLPFTPTGAQKVAVYEILQDFEKPYPMMRLLEGDVGSGKTVVAAVALLNAVVHGQQAAIMAPTEVLARQHMVSITKLIEAYEAQFPLKRPINIQLLVGSLKPKEKAQTQQGVNEGLIDIVIGTHALIQEKVQFPNLGLVVIDEQHRFGVKQREALIKQGSPHVLNMTATPIPRTLTMVAYGDHDLSVLNEMPPGRQPIETKVISPSQRYDMNLFIRHQVEQGDQVFVICPLIEESDTLEVKSVKAEFERLHLVFPSMRIGLMHGKLKPEEKEEVMRQFKDHELDIMVSTSVIEVGIDVPNATIMLIEGADRFGLSQLHQFRGRVGRGKKKSYCFLCTEVTGEAVMTRLSAMVDCQDGFRLAEIDLKLRGPGEVYGVRQSGMPDLKVANVMNGVLMVRVRKAAEHLIETSAMEKHPVLKRMLITLRRKMERA